MQARPGGAVEGFPARRRVSRLVGVLVVSLVLVGCGGDDRQPDSVTWRNVTIDLPDGWYLTEEADTHLSIANADVGPSAETSQARELPSEVVGMFFTYEPTTQPDDWRRFVEQQDATLESDDAIVVGGDVPATRIVYRYVTDGTPTREMAVLIPSRAIVVLAQPVPRPGDDDAPEVFLDHVETFLEVLEEAEFGAPVIDY